MSFGALAPADDVEVAHRADIAAGAEGLACTGEQHDAHAVIEIEFAENARKLFVHFRRQRIELVGTVEADGGDAVGVGDFNTHRLTFMVRVTVT